jgi:hypothetical protein
MAWCKRRALEYIDADNLSHAVASMASDLKTHPDTDNPALNGLVMIGMMYATDGDKAAVQRWIERFRWQRLRSRKAMSAIDLTDDEYAAVSGGDPARQAVVAAAGC